LEISKPIKKTEFSVNYGCFFRQVSFLDLKCLYFMDLNATASAMRLTQSLKVLLQADLLHSR
jgi:hypothetical protein